MQGSIKFGASFCGNQCVLLILLFLEFCRGLCTLRKVLKTAAPGYREFETASGVIGEEEGAGSRSAWHMQVRRPGPFPLFEHALFDSSFNCSRQADYCPRIYA